MSRKLDDFEFQLLGGTDFMIQLIRYSRKVTGLNSSILNSLYEYLELHARGVYHIRSFPGGLQIVIYFEDIIDRENVDMFLRQFYSEENN
jgi:hypothetical protein